MKSVYAFLGVNGSGKGFVLDKIKSQFENPVPLDFSDGVRDYTFSFLGVEPKSELDYENFKVSDSIINLSGQHKVKGRQFLDNVGKKMCEDDDKFWVKYTCNKGHRVPEETDAILFGSCRFLKEARGVVDFAKSIGTEPVFIFCDFISEKYDDSPKPYQQLALKLKELGCKHESDVTNEIMNML